MMILLLAATVAVAGTVVEIETKSGLSAQGEVMEWTDSQLVVAVDGNRSIWQVADLAQIRASVADVESENAPVTLQLDDGSMWSAQDVQLRDGSVSVKATSADASHAVTEIPLSHVCAISWQDAAKTHRDEWQRMLTRRWEADAVIIRRGPDRLDFMEGVIQAISADSVTITLNGPPMDLPRQKLAGVIFLRKQSDPPRKPAVQVWLRDGSHWLGNTVSVRDGQLHVRTSSGLVLRTPFAQFARIEFADQQSVYLSDLDPVEVKVESAYPPRVATDLTMKFLYTPKFNEAFFGRPLALQFPEEPGPRQYQKGIAAHSRTRMVYRFNEPFRQLDGILGWDPEFGKGASVRFQIQAGSSTLFERELFAGDEPIPFQVELPGGKSVILVIDDGDGSDLGDHVNLCNLRLLK